MRPEGHEDLGTVALENMQVAEPGETRMAEPAKAMEAVAADDDEARAPILTFMSGKGGAGKTISLMTIVSALSARGKKVAILEADEMRPITAWRADGLEKGTWDEEILIYTIEDADDLGVALRKADEAGADFVFIDTKGGGSDLNQTIILNSQLVIVPTALDINEMKALFRTCNYLVDAIEGFEDEVSVQILLNRTPTRDSALAATNKVGLKALVDAEMPVMTSRLPRRQVFSDLPSGGILHRYFEYCRKHPDRRVMAPEVRKAIKDAEILTDEILSLLEPEAKEAQA